MTRATCQRCLAVTEQVADIAVMYLKNATENVIDTSVNDVEVIMENSLRNCCYIQRYTTRPPNAVIHRTQTSRIYVNVIILYVILRNIS